MRGALLFAILSVFVLAAHGSFFDSMKKLADEGKKEIAKHLGMKDGMPDPAKMMEDAKKKLNVPKFEADVKAIMDKTRHTILKGWKSHVMPGKTAAAAMPVDKRALEKLMHKMMAMHAEKHIMMARAYHDISHKVAKSVFKTSTPDMKAVTSFSDFARRQMMKVTQGLDKIFKKHGLMLNMAQIEQFIKEMMMMNAVKGGYTEQTAIDALKKVTKTSFNSAALINDLKKFREQMQGEVKTEMSALMKEHKVSMTVDQVQAIVKQHLASMARMLGKFGKDHHMNYMIMLHMAFKGVKKEELEKLLPKILLHFRSAMANHLKLLSEMLKKHNIKDHEHLKYLITLRHVTDMHRHRKGHHRSPLTRMLTIGGCTFLAVILVILIGVAIYMALQKPRRQASAKPEMHEAKKEGLPYSIMNEDAASVAKA